MTAVAEVQDFDTIPTPIVFTDSAAEKVAQLIEEEGNPDLKPADALNLDVSAEYYPDRSSLVSIGVFHKKIDHFIFTNGSAVDAPTQEGVITITQPKNGETARITGVELNLIKSFEGLGAPFDGFGIQGSYTHTEVKADYTAGSRAIKDQLIGLSKNSFNLVGFYDKGPLSARLSYVWRDKYLSSTGSTVQAPTYVAAFGSLDGQLSVRAADR